MLKNLYRSTVEKQFKKLYPTLVQLIQGIRNQQRKIISLSDKILVQTELEVVDVKKDFGVNDFEWDKVVNGVNTDIFLNANSGLFHAHFKDVYGIDISKRKIILNVGRVEPRKNQLKILEAFRNLKLRGDLDSDCSLVFIGDISNRSPEYKFRFKKLLKSTDDVFHLGFSGQDLIASAESSEGIFINASWFETSGLVSIEAAMAGMPVVASGDRVKEYLSGVISCDPKSVESIENAILNGMQKARYSKESRLALAEQYSWEETAKQTIKVYKNILNH